MKILLNNRQEEFENEVISVSELLILKKFSFRMRLLKSMGSSFLKMITIRPS
jgi:hypothetical protein